MKNPKLSKASDTMSQKISARIRLLILTLFAVSLMLSDSLAQDFSWITPNKDYFKLFVVEDAMYRISRSDFSNAGINTSLIDPRTLKVYNKGVQMPVFVQGESDGVFDATDYVDFYGTRNYGGPTIYYTVDNTPYYQKDEYNNMYSDTNVYWIGWDGDNGLRISPFEYTASVNYGSATFLERFHFEKDRVYSQGEKDGSTDYRFFNNELFQGEGWYWSSMYTNLMIQDTFSTPQLPVDPVNCSLNFFAYPQDVNHSVVNEHRIILYINSTLIYDQSRDDFTRFNSTVTFSSSLLNTGSVNYIKVLYQATGYDGHVLLDYVDIKVPRIFAFRAQQLSATLTGSDTTSKIFRVSGFNSANVPFIYDVKNNLKITTYSFSSDTLIFTAKANAKLEVFNRNVSKKPFRMSVKQVPDLVSSSNEADYIVVYNQMFQSQAQQLASHRASKDGFRVKTADMRDIYDIFNYGIESPLAVRMFGRHAYNNWQTPRFRYLCLLGRGSLDPKKNSLSTVYEKNLVPVYGMPTTDSYFANYNIGGFAYLDQVAVGRLPAYTVAEAQNMVSNIISYESKSPDAWMKNHLFVVGGGTASDQSFNQSLITPFINNYVIPPSLSGNPRKAYRVDTSTAVTYNYKDSVRREINNGDAIVSFQGHAGNQNWEDAMHEPSTLDNYGKLPFIMSMTCYTGKTADNTARIFGEKFVTMNNKGAVGFVGSTGWGFAYSGNQLQNHMYYSIARDTVRRSGDIVKYAKSKIAFDSSSSVTRHTINCYGLMGDPAVKLSIPKQPEFHFSADGYRLSEKFPSLNDYVTLTVFPQNFGLHSDSCKIGFTLSADNSTIKQFDTVLYSFKFSDSVRFTFRIDSLKNYSVSVLIDKDNLVPGEDESDNILNIDIPLKNNSFVQLRPVEYEVLSSDTADFTGLNPVTDNPDVKILLQIDTSALFNSGKLKTFAMTNPAGHKTTFRSALPTYDSNRVMFWRTNSIIEGDTAGWTNARSFSFRPSEFSGATSKANRLMSTAIVELKRFGKSQFAAEDIYNSTLTDTGIGLTRYPLNLYVRSMGSSGAEISQFSVNDKAINIDGGRSPGLSLLKVRKVNGSIIEYRNFRLLSSSSIDSVNNFLDSFDSACYLLGLNASYVNQNQVLQLTESAKQRFRTFGSTKIDSMFKFGYFDTWSFIGYLGAPESAVSEQYFRYTSSAGWRESQSSISTTCLKTAGTVSNIVGPADSWHGFSWTQSVIPGSVVSFDALGIDLSGNKQTVISNIITNEWNDLNSISAAQYPQLDLLTKLSIDTVAGYSSSVFQSLKAEYSLPAELILSNSGITYSDSVARLGSELKIFFNCLNAGYADIPGVVINTYLFSSSPANIISTDTMELMLPVDSSLDLSTKFKVPYYRTRGDGTIPIILQVVPSAGRPEFYTYNNSLRLNIPYQSVQSEGFVEIYSDGKLLKSGDRIRKDPQISVSFNKNSVSRISTGSLQRFSLKVNGETVLPGNESISDLRAGKDIPKSNITFSRTEGNDIFRPLLRNGTNRITVLYLADNGEADSASLDVLVSDGFSVTELNNYPNPMKDRTSFIFNLESNEDAKEVRIKIYTTSGRVIRELTSSAYVGVNQIEWDGRDSDGDIIANGTYLYKLFLSEGGETVSLVQKLVVLR